MSGEKKNPRCSSEEIPNGMLSAPQIAYCIKHFAIISDYDIGCLSTCTYNMRIGGNVLFWKNGKRESFTLCKEKNINKSQFKSFELEPNSVAFVTTIEKFHLTSDIIARFNLKSKYIHQGMLLGTGPIVDPEFKGRLMIPVHNFSDQPITLAYGDRLISVEFTKTLPPSQHLVPGESGDGYRPNKSAEFDFDEYYNRLQNKRIESSVATALARHNEVMEKADRRVQNVTIAGILALIFGVIGAFSLVITSLDVINNANQNNDRLREQIEKERDAMKMGRESLEGRLREVQLKLEIVEEELRKGRLADERIGAGVDKREN